MNTFLIGAVLSFLLWIILAFVAAIPAGWVHIPLAVGSILMAVAIVEREKR